MPKPKRPDIEKVCPTCGGSFTYAAYERDRTFCSRGCAARSPSHRAASAQGGRYKRPDRSVTTPCLTCGQPFTRPDWRNRLYCSRECWTKSETLRDIARATGRTLRGKPSNNPYGNGGATKGRKATERQMEGLKVGWEREATSTSYRALHAYAKKHFIDPGICEFCDAGDRPLDWASKDGVTYTRERVDWLRLCRKCHHAHDHISDKIWATRRARRLDQD